MNTHNCMDIFQCKKQLVYEELMVLLCQVIVSLNNLVKISIHKFKENINISEVPSEWR
jgi:hypothetical protein